jgi:hypothetical protein
MTYDEILSEVYLYTKRPDLVARTRSAVRTATLFAHRTDNYWRDLADGILIPVSAAEGNISLQDYLPRFRSLNSIYPVDGDRRGPDLERRDADDLLDEYRSKRTHWFYGHANGIRYHTALLLPNMRVSYWRDPAVDPDTFDSWIARIYPDVIIHWAASLVMRSVGHREEADAELQMAQSLLQELVTNDFNIKGI